MHTLLHDLELAILMSEPDMVRSLLRELSGLRLRLVGFDDSNPMVYASVRGDRRIYGLCAAVSGGVLVLTEENKGPLFFEAPRNVLDDLDPTLDANSIRWRRDCMVMLHRKLTIEAQLGHPYWTALYSREPLCTLSRPAHVCVLLDSPGRGLVRVAATDGTISQIVTIDTDQLARLHVLSQLEWDGSMDWLLASRGGGGIHYMGVGPANYRVGMIFNDRGGLVLWSGLATMCEQLAMAAHDADAAFETAQLLRQLNDLQNGEVVART